GGPVFVRREFCGVNVPCEQQLSQSADGAGQHDEYVAPLHERQNATADVGRVRRARQMRVAAHATGKGRAAQDPCHRARGRGGGRAATRRPVRSAIAADTERRSGCSVPSTTAPLVLAAPAQTASIVPKYPPDTCPAAAKSVPSRMEMGCDGAYDGEVVGG